MKVNFFYSEPYDRMLTDMLGNSFPNEQPMIIKKYQKNLESYWKKEEDKIIKEIEKISNLKFKSNVDCYIVNDMFYDAISNPFTIRIEKDFGRMKSVLIHELIHILFVQNSQKLIKLIEEVPEKQHSYKVHFPLLLIHRKVLENLYGKSYFQKQLKYDNELTELKPLWHHINILYPKFNKDIVKFLKNVDRKI